MVDPIRILLLDADDTVAAACQEIFVSRGWQVDHAHTLREAVALVKNQTYHVTIIEIMLPDAVGAEAWAYLKKRCLRLRGIYVTSSPTLHAAIATTQQDILAYFLKPLQFDVICNQIAQATQTQSAASQIVTKL